MVADCRGDHVTDPGGQPQHTDLDARYGRRTSGRKPLLVLAVVVAVAGLGWLTWVAIEHSRPPVTSRLMWFQVGSATETTAGVLVERREHEPASCRLQAKAADFAVVGETTVEVPADASLEHVVKVTLSTQRRATSITLVGCTTAGSDRPR
jgi:Domain of unknown function (DUF4307)